MTTATSSIVRCPKCGTKNRIDLARAARSRPRCARCHATLVIPQPQTRPVEVTDQNFASEVEAAPIPVLVEFWSPFCLYCQRLEPVIQKLAAQGSPYLKIAKLNIDQNPLTAARYRVTGTPTIAVLDRGRELERIEGAVPEEELRYRLFRFFRPKGS